MTSIIDKVVELHDALGDASIPHAFGGALALAWCTEQARGTIDIDLNVFLDPDAVDQVLAALPDDVEVTKENRRQLERDGQTRLWWHKTPLDLFLNTTPFHADVGRRSRVEEFNSARVPFLACRDIAVFKAFFDRDKDWTDLRAMARAGTLDAASVIGVLALYLGGDDVRIEKLRAISQEISPRDSGSQRA